MPDAPLPAAESVYQQRYLAHAAQQLPGRPVTELTMIAQRHAELGGCRQSEDVLVHVGDLDAATTYIDIVTADVPYLVDSARAELTRTGHPVRHLLHPQLAVSRDAAGRLLAVLDLADTAALPDGAILESWMHIEIDQVPSDEHAAVVADLRHVLTDVHAAVADGPAMRMLFGELADRIELDPGHFDRDVSTEAAALLRWLADGNYQVLGHADYSANELAGAPRPVHASRQGVLRGQASVSAPELLPAYRSGAPVVIFKSPMVSTVRRADRYDCVTVVAPATASQPEKIHVFLGLVREEDSDSVSRVPVLRRRFAEVLQRSGARADSHTGRQLVSALRTLPRDELLQATTSDLLTVGALVVDRADHGGTGVFARTHLNRDFVTVLVYFPGDRLGPETRTRVRNVVLSNYPGRIIARDDRIVELSLARMYFLIALRPGEEVPDPDRAAVEAKIAQLTRRWSDDLSDLLTLGVGEQEAERIQRRYAGAIPEAYKEDFPAVTGVTDVRRLETLPDLDGLAFDVYTPPATDDADRRLKMYRTGTPLSLGRILPMLERMGIEVLDERPYEIERADGTAAWIYDFGLRLGDGVDFSPSTSAAVIDTLRVLWRGGIEQDGFNALVVRAGLTWRSVSVLRAYAKYLRQAGIPFSEGYIEQTLTANPGLAGLLIELFQTRFDPEQPVDNDAAQQRLRTAIDASLTSVASLDQDRILRSLRGLIDATLRTNYYQTSQLPSPASDGTAVTMEQSADTALAFKIDSRAVAELPQPRPQVEIWVYSPRVEGVHLRFGPVARGGIRWSDRREDFRTEVLGLVKAQMVKNVVIVPVGSKGGFVAKKLIDPAVDREAWLSEGIACYRVFITALLELTDNYRAFDASEPNPVVQQVLKPERTRCYDGDDPYLVVAADKGTATFSDIANGIALERGFWLGDAFASGGSVGYDHKAMGITARGAWESVKYHFRELDLDTQTQDFTVIGIGDMSGDVFGNGMLLSKHIRLVAAFDHRHIFLDPDPDPAVSLAERQRLFALPRSSWADYDAALLSPGGGVHARTLKSVPITEPVAVALGLPATTTRLAPSELLHAILTAPVDLLWNGGIGTYVKASTESQLQVGDKANDAFRADGAELRCRVVGEGGNLGFTQLGRIEFARGGGRINTDAIDNSAGVDTSDHEVNIKILLDRGVHAGKLTTDERNQLLVSVTGEVAESVLRDNYEQNVLLGIARSGAPALVSVHRRLIRAMEKSGRLDRRLESLPSDKELASREANGEGLCSPELAVLAAYVKIGLADELADSATSQDPWFQGLLHAYFPTAISDRFAAELRAHPLYREIITTAITNDLVNRAGISFVYRAEEETSASSAQLARAYTVVREVFALDGIWDAIEKDASTGGSVTAQHQAYRETRRLIDRAVRWLIDVRFPLSDVSAEIARYAGVVRELTPRVPALLMGRERSTLEADIERLCALGISAPLATEIGTLLSAFLLLDVVEIAAAERRPALEVAQVHFALSERLGVDDLLTAVTRLPREDRWSALARSALRHDVYGTLAATTTAVLRSTADGQTAGERIGTWATANSERVERAHATLIEALAQDAVDLATVSVALRALRQVANAAS